MQTPSFEQLHTLEDNPFIPQLEYIIKCWDAIYNCGPEMATQFIDRYNYGHIKHLDKLRTYLKDEMTQTVLKVYGLDPEKFWYLLLMAVDYTEGYGSDMEFNEVPSVQLDKAFSLIEANLAKHEIEPMGFKFAHDPEMKLTLTVKQPGKKNNTTVSIDTPNALAYLSYLYAKASGQEKPHFMNEAIGADFMGIAPIPETERLAIFAKMLITFLSPLEATPGIVGRDIPKDKYFLVSQFAYMMALTRDSRFIDPTRTRYLRDYIKDKESTNIMGENRHYNFDFLLD